MKKISGLVLISAVLGLSGCGGDDFDGVYLAEGGFARPDFALSIHGDSAEAISVNKETGEFSGRPTFFDVSYKNETALLDSTTDNLKLSFKRAEDQRGLTCINCGGFGLKENWRFVKDEPLDIESIMEEQHERLQAARKAKEELRASAAKLEKFKGDWVGTRAFYDDSLIIRSISTESGIDTYVFNYHSGVKQVEYSNDFEVDGDKLVLKFKDDEVMEYVLEDNGEKLRCVSCSSDGSYLTYLKADSERINNQSYARELAGDPQNKSWE